MKNFEPSADLLKLREWVKQTIPDSEFTWETIAKETGILMNTRGKGLLRRAAKYDSVEYSTVRGVGIVLAGPITGARIVEGRIHRASRAISHSGQAYSNISSKFLKDMTPDDQKRIMFIGSVFAAMNEASRLLKMPKSQGIVLSRIPPKLPNS